MNGERELLRTKVGQLHNDLQSAGSDTVTLAYQLYSRCVIGKGVRSEIEDAATPGKAASKLLGAVENKIESHPRELHTFLDCLGTFPTWQHHAEEISAKLKEIEERMVRPLPETSEGTKNTFVLRSAPIQRKHPPQQATVTPPQPTGKTFPNAASPVANTPGISGSDQNVPSCPAYSNSLQIVEETDNESAQHQHTLSLSSQVSISSTFGEDVQSMQGVLEKVLKKYSEMKRKLSSSEREKDEMKRRFVSAVGSANQDTKELKGQVNNLHKESSDLKERLDTMRETVIAGNRQKKLLLDQLQLAYDEVQRYKEIYSSIDGTVLEEYQRSKEREKELEDQLMACKKTVADHEEKIQLLEEEIDILLKLPSYSTTDEWTANPEQEDSGGLLSLGSL